MHPPFSLLLLASALLLVNGNSLSRYARVVEAEEVKDASYDFIIVGGGTAGLTVADRLTEDPSVCVLVIEYGPFDQGEDSVLIPGSFNPGSYLWPNLFSTPQPGLNNRTFFVTTAAVVGGGSTVNAMFMLRGGAGDYNAWAALGNPGWSWTDLLPYFKKSENFTVPDTAYAKAHNLTYDANVHGTDGPIHTLYGEYDYPVGGNWYTAARASGITPINDSNGGIVAGLTWLLRAVNAATGRRSYAKNERYDRVKTRSNYHILTETVVSKVLFKNKITVGVQYIIKATGVVSNVSASKEVIISAGGVHTPQILQLSGIGPTKLLDSFGIPTIVDLPGVGQNFHDHLQLNVQYNVTNNVFPNADTFRNNATYNTEQRAIYDATNKGAYTLTATTANNVVHLPLKNTTTAVIAASIIAKAKAQDPAKYLPAGADATVIKGYTAARKAILSQFDGFTEPVGEIFWNTGSQSAIYTIKPLSRGVINIASADPLVQPLINYNSLADPTDIDVTLALYKKNREIMAQPMIALLGAVEISPAPATITDDAQLKELLNANLLPSVAHQCCTAALGKRGLGGVVDSDLLVYGVKNLSIIDASVFPFLPAGAPAATVYAMAEKAVVLIKKRNRTP
ncbi:hypothetical protein B0O99DRAFT_643598 [Bisporella sp. PMI_857]|nr:hypothetical protein B0O99DRAFT_643598 [Bisporella sp. PMI_857]